MASFMRVNLGMTEPNHWGSFVSSSTLSRSLQARQRLKNTAGRLSSGGCFSNPSRRWSRKQILRTICGTSFLWSLNESIFDHGQLSSRLFNAGYSLQSLLQTSFFVQSCFRQVWPNLSPHGAPSGLSTIDSIVIDFSEFRIGQLWPKTSWKILWFTASLQGNDRLKPFSISEARHSALPGSSPHQRSRSKPILR